MSPAPPPLDYAPALYNTDRDVYLSPLLAVFRLAAMVSLVIFVGSIVASAMIPTPVGYTVTLTQRIIGLAPFTLATPLIIRCLTLATVPSIDADDGRRLRRWCWITFALLTLGTPVSIVLLDLSPGFDLLWLVRMFVSQLFLAAITYAFLLLVPVSLGRRIQRLPHRLATFAAAVLIMDAIDHIELLGYFLRPGPISLQERLSSALNPYRSPDMIYRQPAVSMLLTAGLLLYAVWQMESRILRAAGWVGLYALIVKEYHAYQFYQSAMRGFPEPVAYAAIAIQILCEALPFAALVLLAWLAHRPNFVGAAEPSS